MLLNINLISNFKQNLTEDFYQQNISVLILTHAVFAKESKKAKMILLRKDKKMKQSKRIIKHKGCQKLAPLAVQYQCHVIQTDIKLPIYYCHWLKFWSRNITDNTECM